MDGEGTNDLNILRELRPGDIKIKIPEKNFREKILGKKVFYLIHMT